MAAILCVDDDDTIRFLLHRILQTAGHDAATCDNGGAALELVAQNPPDLLVLDLQMPGLSGFEVCRRLKANPFTARIPILMVTAQNDIESKIAGFEAGADDYLGKPFLPQELTVRVASLYCVWCNAKATAIPPAVCPADKRLQRPSKRVADRISPFCISTSIISNPSPTISAFRTPIA